MAGELGRADASRQPADETADKAVKQDTHHDRSPADGELVDPGPPRLDQRPPTVMTDANGLTPVAYINHHNKRLANATDHPNSTDQLPNSASIPEGAETTEPAETDRRGPVQVPYESTSLARAVAEGRRDSPNPLTMKNAAIFEYSHDGVPKLSQVGFSRNPGLHAERNIWSNLEKQGVRPDQVTRIYTELEPCTIPTPAAGCAAWIDRMFPQAEVTYSFEYGSTQESRSAGNEARRSYMIERFGEESSDRE
ncbi:nucleic acid/nucleotide deaminase domain-containing protein [Microlunatus parietis]|uniref:Uncharacterized protein n=1 Tax=Microlunatus parietis TaxID=682979 RepID=A0A7Y9LGJ3_9ACTN|nr:nucleic acid/nucleotide deaminase domain-containing protein [Microlunatus parietis]NYE75256.1 hypothetical protein [Microlunatus parietis]